AYLNDGKFYDWLRLHPANRLLLATLAWNHDKGRDYPPTPAYTLGRSMKLHDKNLELDQRKEIEEDRDGDIHQAFVNTLTTPKESEEVNEAIKGKGMGKRISKSKVYKQNLQATNILRRVFILLQAGLKVCQIDEHGEAEHVDYEEGDVARALA